MAKKRSNVIRNTVIIDKMIGKIKKNLVSDNKPDPDDEAKDASLSNEGAA